MADARYEPDDGLSEDFTDSDASDVSSCSEDSSDERSSPSCSPRSEQQEADRQDSLPLSPLLPAGQISPKRSARPKVPALGLRMDAAASGRGLGSATPRSLGQQDSARGRPTLAVPRLATARSTEDSASARELLPNSARAPVAPRVPQQLHSSRLSLPIPQLRCDGRPQHDAPAVTVAVGLLSNAVVLRHQQKSITGPQLAKSALSEIGVALGVRQSELTLYEVREIQDPAQLASSTSKLAIAVNSSGEGLLISYCIYSCVSGAPAVLHLIMHKLKRIIYVVRLLPLLILCIIKSCVG